VQVVLIPHRCAVRKNRDRISAGCSPQANSPQISYHRYAAGGGEKNLHIELVKEKEWKCSKIPHRRKQPG